MGDPERPSKGRGEPAMRDLFTLVALVAVAAAGCITERGTVRGDRQVESAPPPPADPAYMPSDPAAPAYQAEAPPPPPAGTDVSSDAVFYERLSPYGSWT